MSPIESPVTNSIQHSEMYCNKANTHQRSPSSTLFYQMEAEHQLNETEPFTIQSSNNGMMAHLVQP